MLKEITGNTVKVRCVDCGTITSHDVTNVIAKYIPEFDEYQNVRLPCTCGTVELFNVNIPTDAEEEPFETGELPLEEEVQRYYVRLLQRLVREDLITKTS